MSTPNAMIVDLKGMTPKEIDRFCTEALGRRSGQGLRVAQWLFRKHVEDFNRMDGINRPFREQLKARCHISSLAVERTENADDGTKKLLYLLDDGNTVEGVLIPGSGRLTLCVSSQVGCASGCGFCRTGNGGFIRNLAPAEIVNQVFAASGQNEGRSISNIVLMGSGEPLSNFDAVRSFIETATDPFGLGFPPKRVTISTCGLAPAIERLADEEVPASLAVSLNATTDGVRDRLMPVNRSWPIGRLMRSLRYYTERTGRSVTIEYVLFRDVNDSSEDALRLVDLTEDLPCMVNMLTFNPYPGCVFEPSGAERLAIFRDILVRASRIAVVRKSRGRDINAACGQLRAASRPAPP